MSLHRFFVSEILTCDLGDRIEVPLSGADLHHAVHVLRLRAGESVAIIDGDHRGYEMALVNVDAERVAAEVVRVLPTPYEPRVTLVQGLTKGSKLEWIVEKAVEIGVEAIWPIGFRRSIQHLDAERARKKGERWRRVALAAAKQSGRSFVPRVEDPGDATGLVKRLSEFDIVLLPWEESAWTAPGIREALTAQVETVDKELSEVSLALVVGPEGGLDDEEVAALRGAGAVAVSLGETVLRSETAAVVAVALCAHELGGLGGRVRE